MLVLSNGLSLPVTASYLRSDPIAVQRACRRGALHHRHRERSRRVPDPCRRRPSAGRRTSRPSSGTSRASTGAQLRAVDRVLGQRFDHDRAHRDVHRHPRHRRAARDLRREHGDDPVRPPDGTPAGAGVDGLERVLVRLVRGSCPWIAISIYLFGGPAAPPTFVYAITAVELVLFFSFAVNMVLQYRQVGRWRDYLAGESTYIVLSLTAKSLLAWLIFANVLRS